MAPDAAPKPLETPRVALRQPTGADGTERNRPVSHGTRAKHRLRSTGGRWPHMIGRPQRKGIHVTNKLVNHPQNGQIGWARVRPLRTSQGWPFQVLSDINSEASRAFGVAFTLDDATRDVYNGFGLDLPTLNGAGTWELLVPGTFIIGSNAIITYAFVEADYRLRAEPAEILKALA